MKAIILHNKSVILNVTNEATELLMDEVILNLNGK